ncbi:MAG: aspartate--tRNA(Asn) ligase [Euryarchaeota archaeon]|nr:aspartate--tRNA(Asn) ligase [Euryarchaeota archaeon]
MAYASVRTLSPADDGKEVSVAGWAEDIRNLGGIVFVILRQREGTLQLAARKKENPPIFEALAGLVRESVIAAKGVLKANPQARNGWEVFPTQVEVLSRAEAPLPLGVVDKVGADLDTRLDNRVMDLRKPERRAIFHVRDLLIGGIREYLHRHGFVEVTTPKLAGAGAEGGATLFRTDYFGKVAFLSQSPQLYKQMLMATGLDRVFELSPAFRAEPSDTVRHVTEFLSFDAEVAPIRHQEDFLKILEGCVANAIASVREHGKPYLDLLAADPKAPSLPIPRVPYSEALDLLAVEGKNLRDGDDLDTEAEKVLGRVMAAKGHDLFFLVEYPSAIKPFYVMVKEDDPDVSYSFDLEYKGDEMASGGQREHRYDRLVARMKGVGLNPEAFEFYLRAFRYGMPPHGGWGLGIDRLVQKVLDLPNIREAILFPRDRNRLVP